MEVPIEMFMPISGLKYVSCGVHSLPFFLILRWICVINIWLDVCTSWFVLCKVFFFSNNCICGRINLNVVHIAYMLWNSLTRPTSTSHTFQHLDSSTLYDISCSPHRHCRLSVVIPSGPNACCVLCSQLTVRPIIALSLQHSAQKINDAVFKWCFVCSLLITFYDKAGMECQQEIHFTFLYYNYNNREKKDRSLPKWACVRWLVPIGNITKFGKHNQVTRAEDERHMYRTGMLVSLP